MHSAVTGIARQVLDTWARWISILLGVWLMAAPAVLRYAGSASATHRLVGPIVAASAFVAVWEHMRALRWMNVPLGAALLLTPWPLEFGPAAMATSLSVGIALIALAPIKGPTRNRFGWGWAALWRGTSVDERERER